jgi:hypothetical protein
MAVSELLRGLAGALVGALALLILLLCLVETRERFGQPVRGVAWMSMKGRTAQFDPVWKPTLFYGFFFAITGYMAGVRLTDRRAVRCTIVGALIAVAIWMVVPSPLPEKFGRAGQNTVYILSLFATFLGGAFGALYAERTNRQRFSLDDES